MIDAELVRKPVRSPHPAPAMVLVLQINEIDLPVNLFSPTFFLSIDKLQ